MISCSTSTKSMLTYTEVQTHSSSQKFCNQLCILNYTQHCVLIGIEVCLSIAQHCQNPHRLIVEDLQCDYSGIDKQHNCKLIVSVLLVFSPPFLRISHNCKERFKRKTNAWLTIFSWWARKLKSCGVVEGEVSSFLKWQVVRSHALTYPLLSVVYRTYFMPYNRYPQYTREAGRGVNSQPMIKTRRKRVQKPPSHEHIQSSSI